MEWISVKDKLPNKHTTVKIKQLNCDYYKGTLAHLDSNGWVLHLGFGIRRKVDFWMAL